MNPAWGLFMQPRFALDSIPLTPYFLLTRPKSLIERAVTRKYPSRKHQELQHRKEVIRMAYTPELSYRNSATLRRLAWFRGKPMTRILEALLEATGRTMAEERSGEVCANGRTAALVRSALFSTRPRTNPPQHPTSKSDHNHQQESEQIPG